MSHSGPRSGSHRVHLIYVFVLAIITMLLTSTVLSFRADSAQAQGSEGTISTIAGSGNREFGNGEGVDPFGMAVDDAGNVYIADLNNHRIRKVDPNGVMTVVAGNGEGAFGGDGGPATSASLFYPHDVAIDSAGNLYIADLNNNRIRKVDTNGIITTVAGNGSSEFSGDGGPATSASLRGPKGVAIDAAGNLYIADFNNARARKVDTNGIITTVAGNGFGEFSGDGSLATSSGFSWLTDVEVDAAGNLYLADESKGRIYKVDTNGVITAVAGNGIEGFGGDSGPATSASLAYSKRIALDHNGNLYLSDSRNNRVRKVDPNGIITTVAGNGSDTFSGDGGPATSAGLWAPNGLTVDKAGNLYIGADSRIRKVVSVTSADSGHAPTNNVTTNNAAGTESKWQAKLTFTHGAFVDSVAWSPDGTKLASGGRDDNIKVWDAATGANLLTISGHSDDAVDVAWSPDGSKIASVSDASDMSLRIWDATTGAALHTLTGHTGRLDSVLWSPDGTKVVSASPIDESVRVWDATTGANLLTLTPPSIGGSTSVAWSPDGTKLASTTNSSSIVVWDGNTGDTILTLTGFTGSPSQLAWSPDGSKIASGSFDRSARIWDATSGDIILTINSGGASRVAWSPDGSKLAVTDEGGKRVTVWDATTGTALHDLPADITMVSPVVWSPDGSKIATATWNLIVLIWDAKTGASLATLPGHGDGITGAGNLSMVWSPDGSQLATGGADPIHIWAEVAAVAPGSATPTVAPTSAPTTEATATPTAEVPILQPTPTPTPTVDPNAPYFEPSSLNFVWQKGSRSNPASQKVVVRNIGGAGWTMHQWVSVPAKQWLSGGGGFEMTIAVSPANANLDVGIHDTKLDFVTNGVTITLPIQITVVSADGKLEVNRKKLNFGGFLGDPITSQEVGLTFTGLNNSNWTASGPSWLTLTPASGSVSATSPAALTVGVNTTSISEAGKQTGTLTVTDGKTTHEIAVELFQVAPGSPTIQLFSLEVTQGLQNLNNDIPFVAKRPTFVRGHVRSLTGESIGKVTAELIGTRDGVELGRLAPINPGGSIDIVANPDRAQLNESFLFELPENWRTGTVTLKLVGKSQPIACVDPAEKSAANGVADDCTVTLTYDTVPALPITYFLYKDVGNITLPNGKSTANFEATASHANDASRGLIAGLPIPGVDQQIHGTTLTYPGMRNSSGDNGKVLDEVRKLYEGAGKPSRHYYGLFARYPTTTDPKTQSQGGPGGVASVPGFVGMGEYYTFQPYSLLNAHEIAHNLGRNHVNCGNPANPDLKFPHPNQQISDVLSGDAAYYGFNIFSKEIYPPTHKDMMAYCWPQWVSPYTYKALMEELKVHYAPSGATSTAASANSPSPILLINGTIADTEDGSIDGVVGDDGYAAIPAENASGYSVRLEDADGQIIGTYPVEPQVTEGQNHEHDHEESISYTLAIPRPENLARVVLLYNDQPLDERVGSSNAPMITLTAPVGGESIDNQSLVIAWEASDDDGDELRFNVDYSTDDGVSWQKLVWDWAETELVVDSSHLPGSTQARIRVSANDGFHTTFAESEAFAVTDHAPVAIILSTALNRYYVGGQTILLEGAGYDREDGELSNLIWHSDRDGVLGTGPTLLVDADNLTEGTHLIRLEAVDSMGQSSFGDSTMVIASEEGAATVNDSVSFDILYDPLTLPAELSVSPNLGFLTVLGDTQLLTGTLIVSNLGDGNLGWTASSDSDNVTLSSNSGETPAIVVVMVNPTGLTEGVHEGVITFTSTEADLEPVTVNYFVNMYDLDGTLPRIQAESGTYVGEADSADIYGGFEGSGFAAYMTTAGSGVQLNANVASTGTYAMIVRYAAGPHGPEADRTISLYVNGDKARQLVFGRTFDWAEWADLITSIDLIAGDNTIEFRVDDDDTGHLNIDYISGTSVLDESDMAGEDVGDEAVAEVPPAENDTASGSGSQIAMCNATDVALPGSGAVMVRFVNDSDGHVSIFWRSFDGNLLEYHQLDAASYVEQETFETHEWVVQDAAGNVLLEYAASADTTQCVLIR